MITLLLVCIFFGVNIRICLDSDKMHGVLEIILPLNIYAIKLRLNLVNGRIFYNINGHKDREITIPQSKNKQSKQFKKIKIDRISYTLVVGSSEDCLTGLYLSNLVHYLSNILPNLLQNYVEIENFDKVIMPDFKGNNSKLIINIFISKGIIDIIKNIFAKKKKEEVKYAN